MLPWSYYIFVFNEVGTEKPRTRKPRNTLCKQLIIKRRRSTILPSYIAFMWTIEQFQDFQIWLNRSESFPQKILWRSKRTTYQSPSKSQTFNLVKSRSDKFLELDFVSKQTRISQIAVNIFFDVGFQDLIVFIGLSPFILWHKASSFVFNFELWRNSVIIDFLVNKSIFRQTKYLVICFTLRAYLTWEYEQNLFFVCCRDMFHHWYFSPLRTFTLDSYLGKYKHEETEVSRHAQIPNFHQRKCPSFELKHLDHTETVSV